MSLQDDLKDYGLSEDVVYYLTHIGKIMCRQDFRNKAVILDRLSTHPVETYLAVRALQLVPGFEEEYLREEAA